MATALAADEDNDLRIEDIEGKKRRNFFQKL